MIHGLNRPQSDAAEHTEGPLLVFAGAGSGKTRVITYRTANLLRQVDPERVLLVTFTNKAAREMKERMEPLVGREKTGRLWAGTFHATGCKILRQHAERFDRRRDFVIYDDSDQETVVKQIVAEERLDKKFWTPALVMQRIGKAKQNAFAPADIPIDGDETATFVRLWKRYESWLVSCNAVDFEDLILLPLRLVEGQDATGESLRRRFRYVLVDEFQDTNETQYRLVKGLATSRNLCVVGDDDQCIYTWRGANVKNIREFHKEFPDATVVKLEQNYRSTKAIVGCALGIIAESKLRVAKQLFTQNPNGDLVAVVETGSDRDEARFVAKRMKDRSRRGDSWATMTVLYRTHAQSRAIEDELRDRQVPYRIVGGHKFYDRKEVKDVMGYLRLVANHDSDVDLLRVINVPPRGIGASTTKRLGEIAASRRTGLWKALPVAEAADEIGRKERLQLKAFRDTIEQFGKGADSGLASEIAQRLITGTGYRKMWAKDAEALSKEGKFSDAQASLDRVRNVDEVVNAIASYEARSAEEGRSASLKGYLQMVSLAEEESKEGADQVTLMTVHAAKGLEFETVFLVGFEDGRFPPKAVDLHPLELEEERRLAYVAFTRARSRLFVTHAVTRFVRGQLESWPPSRFIHDLPPEMSERIDQDAYEDREQEAAHRRAEIREGQL